jgi:hypothetical protein
MCSWLFVVVTRNYDFFLPSLQLLLILFFLFFVYLLFFCSLLIVFLFFVVCPQVRQRLELTLVSFVGHAYFGGVEE